VIADPQMIAFGFDVGVDHLIVEKLRGLRPPGNTPPVVIIQQAAEKRELPLPIQDLDLHEICELPGECLHVLVEPSLGKPEGFGFLLDPSEPSGKMPTSSKFSVLFGVPDGI
jgi:hypothetical protein